MAALMQTAGNNNDDGEATDRCCQLEMLAAMLDQVKYFHKKHFLLKNKHLIY
jgi:hypothetical protein